jgi:prepilin signal peptidase PulO-like enzyme (type II secretory pathway)
MRDDAVETQLAFDMVKRAVPAAPFIVALSWLLWGSRGAWSALLAVAVVTVNLVLAAVSLAWAARVSPAALMGTALFGFLARMMLVTGVVVAVKHASWVNLTALAITILVTHLGLLVIETKYVGANLAFPGLKPSEKGA